MKFNVTSTRRRGILQTIQTMATSMMSASQMIELRQIAMDFMDSGRGKQKGRGFIKSIAGKTGGTNWRKPHQGAKECARRIKQGLA